MLTLTLNMGNRILSVKPDENGMDDLDLLRELLARFDALKENAQVPQKALAYAVGVAESRVPDWRDMVAGKREPNLNHATRNEIRSLLTGDAEARSEGMAWTLKQLKATAGDVEDALLVRERLSATQPPEGEGAERVRARAKGAPPPGVKLPEQDDTG